MVAVVVVVACSDSDGSSDSNGSSGSTGSDVYLLHYLISLPPAHIHTHTCYSAVAAAGATHCHFLQVQGTHRPLQGVQPPVGLVMGGGVCGGEGDNTSIDGPS